MFSVFISFGLLKYYLFIKLYLLQVMSKQFVILICLVFFEKRKREKLNRAKRNETYYCISIFFLLYYFLYVFRCLNFIFLHFCRKRLCQRGFGVQPLHEKLRRGTHSAEVASSKAAPCYN